MVQKMKTKTSSTSDETHSIDGNENKMITSAATSLSTPITSGETALQIRAATDSLTRKLEKLCEFMLELHKDSSGRNDETSAPVKKPSRPPRERFDMVTGAHSAAHSELLHGTLNPMTKQPHGQRRPFLLDDGEDEPELSNNSRMNHVVTADNNLPHILQRDATHTRILNTQAPNVSGSKDNLHDFQHLLHNQLRPHQNCITEEHKLQYFQSLSRGEALDFWQALRITLATTLKNYFNQYGREFAEDDPKKVSLSNGIS